MNENILSGIQDNPEVMQAVGAAVQEMLQDPDIDRESVDQLVRMLEFVMQNPDSYNEFRQTAIQGGMLDPEDLPEQFSAEMLTVVLLALKVVQQQMADGSPGFARGGLNRVAQMGRRGDSELAHINPFERRLLQAYGGSGTINPQTGLREFGLFSKLGKALKKVFKAVAPVLPIVLSFVAPGVGTAIGSALSGGALAGTAASMLGSAAIGGLGSAAAGGDALKGAIGGALGAGAGSALGGYVGDTLGIQLGDTAKNVVGSSLIGGAQSAATGGDFVSGALKGGLGGYAGSALSGAASGVGGALGAGLQTAGQQFGNALTMGASPTEALAGAALSGLASGMMYTSPTYDLAPQKENMGLKSPSESVLNSLRAPSLQASTSPEAGLQQNYMTGDTSWKGPDSFTADYSLTPSGQNMASSDTGGLRYNAPSPLTAISSQASAATTPSGSASKGFSLSNAATVLPLISMFGSAQTPEEVQRVVAGMTPEQQEYFNRPMKTWNWDTIGAAAKMQGIPVGSYIARNWDKMSGGAYDNPETASTTTPALARGGALSRMAYLAAGGGTGRSDSIDAKLSDGEYVMDAETVALLGDGSTGAGARRLDEMRAKIRQHKGKSMARGKFSANAKSPLSYLKGA